MATVASDIKDVPDALTARTQWVCWRREERDGKATKVPVDPTTGGYASTTEPDTWTDIETALEGIEAADADGVGFVFTDGDPLVGVDLDDCRAPESGAIDEWARDIVTRLDSYAEVSPSGTGVHVIAEGELPDGRSRSGDVEMYETSRFFTVTGAHLDVTPTQVCRRNDAIGGVHADNVQDQSADVEDGGQAVPDERNEGGGNLEDDELLNRAREAENGDRFEALFQGQTASYDSHSEADMALCMHLAFWTGGDPSRIDALFRQSGLHREKWDEVHYADGATYGERTIDRALDRIDEVYEPEKDMEGESSSTQASGPTDESGSGEDESPTASALGDESVYVEERNRLLREKVQSQAATIDRQRDRIDQLEDELERAREQLTIQEGLRDDFSEDGGNRSRFWGWLRDR